MNCYVFLNLLIVLFAGILWGLLEIVVRYDLKYLSGHKKKRKEQTVNNDVVLEKEESAWVYVICYLLLNGVISILAFIVLKHCAKEPLGNIQNVESENIIIAGFSGMLILRSSIFSIVKDNHEINIGFISVTQLLLEKIDKKIRHNIAAKRICEIYEIMKDVDYEKAKDELPDLCINYIDDFSAHDSKELINAIKVINGNLSMVNKSLQLGREIARYCDVEILKRAVKKLPIKDASSQLTEEVNTDDDEFEVRKKQLYKK